MSQRISAVLIIKNEAHHLEACLNTLDWVDEIVIYDSGSTDNSIKIAKQFTTQIHQDTQWDGYGRQRQKAQEKASGDWVFMVDADERVTPELAKNIKAFIQKNEHCIASVPRLSWCFGRFIRHSGWYPDRVLRLYPNTMAKYDDAQVHETLQNPSNLPVIALQGDLLHYTYRNLRHYLEKSAYYAELWGQQKHAQGKQGSLSSALSHGVFCFIKMYVLKRGFLDGAQGFILAALSAHSTFAKYIDLWIRTKTKERA